MVRRHGVARHLALHPPWLWVLMLRVSSIAWSFIPEVGLTDGLRPFIQ